MHPGKMLQQQPVNEADAAAGVLQEDRF